MKSLSSTVLILLLTLTSTVALAQVVPAPKPALFSAYSDVINCNKAELSKTFTYSSNQVVTLTLANNFSFTGIVTSNIVKYSNLQTVIIKSQALKNVIFQLSKRTNADNSVSYIGRIINQQYSDGYELKQDAAGNYQLKKVETDRVIQNCSLN